MKLELSRRIFDKCSNIKFHENPSSGGRVIPCRQTDKRTDMKKLKVAVRNFANESKNQRVKLIIRCITSDCVVYVV